MIALVSCAVAVLALDPLVKWILVRRVGTGSIRLGSIGELRITRAPIWLMRGPRSPRMATIWLVWLSSSVGLALLCAAVPRIESLAGLLLGGSLSHAIEMSRHGAVSDYICLRFWPAFDLADIAVAIGTGGIALELLAWMRTV